jgi:hypothetical protein
MSFHARSFRKELNKQLKKQLIYIINYHVDKIESLVKTYQRDKMYIYTVHSYVPGYKEYNPNVNGKVYKSIVNRLKQQRYKITELYPNKIKIEWNLTNKKALKEYISSLVMNIYTLIQTATKNNLSCIEYIVPFHIRYPPHKVATSITEHLKKRNFKVQRNNNNNMLIISW